MLSLYIVENTTDPGVLIPVQSIVNLKFLIFNVLNMKVSDGYVKVGILYIAGCTAQLKGGIHILFCSTDFSALHLSQKAEKQSRDLSGLFISSLWR